MEIGLIYDEVSAYFSQKKFIGFFGKISDLETLTPSIKYLEFNMNNTVKQFIKNKNLMTNCGFKSDTLKTKLRNLSGTEFKLATLIKAIALNPKVIILNHFDIGLNNETQSRIIKLIKSINENKEINFIIISNNISFLSQTVSDVVVMKNRVIKYQGDLMNALKQNLIETPKIIDFINLANSKNASLDYTLEIKELLKSIYRSVS